VESIQIILDIIAAVLPGDCRKDTLAHTSNAHHQDGSHKINSKPDIGLK